MKNQNEINKKIRTWPWLNRFIQEKEIDEEITFEYEIGAQWHLIPVGSIIDAMHISSDEEKKTIKETIIKIDFYNGDVYHYFKHLGECLARSFCGV